MTGIVIIGAGFGGIGMAIALKKAGYHDFVIMEKSEDLGGTWHHNQYPGCACDVPSPLYSYSFELNQSWSRMFAPQQEIRDYLRMCTRKYGVDEHIRYGRTVEHLDWDDQAWHWNIATSQTSGTGRVDGTEREDSYRAQAVVSAGGGARHRPSCPDIPGNARFGGSSFHSAQWDSSVELGGKRVAVIGTGASAIQFIPEIAERAGHPRRIPAHPAVGPSPAGRTDLGPAARDVRAYPVTARLTRDAISLALESRALGFAVHLKLMAPLEQVARRRILLSSDYYPALQRPNVDLITSDITEITVITADGTAHPTDVIIYATGFDTIESARRPAAATAARRLERGRLQQLVPGRRRHQPDAVAGVAAAHCGRALRRDSSKLRLCRGGAAG